MTLGFLFNPMRRDGFRFSFACRVWILYLQKFVMPNEGKLLGLAIGSIDDADDKPNE